MLVRVFFNDAAGGSFSPGSPNGERSKERRGVCDAYRAAGRRVYMPMMDGYRADAVLVESELSPLIFDEKDPLRACERAFTLMNGEFRSNGPRERSLSVGDLVEIDGVKYACQPVGFEEVA